MPPDDYVMTEAEADALSDTSRPNRPKIQGKTLPARSMRLKVFRVCLGDLIAMFNVAVLPEFGLRLLHEKMPEDSRVLSAQVDMASRSLELLVESESFNLVPDGYRAPVADGPAGVEAVRLVCHKCKSAGQ